MPIIRIIRNYYNTLNNSGAIERVEMGGKPAQTEKQIARNKLFKTVSVICLFSLLYVLFASPKQHLRLKAYSDIKQNDIVLPEEFFFKDETIVTRWYDDGDYDAVVDFCERNPDRKVYYEDVVIALSYLKSNNIPSAIEKFDEIKNDPSNPFNFYSDYKLAYLHVLINDVKGLDMLNRIVENEKHPYCKEAVKFLNSRLCRGLFVKKGKENYTN